MSDIAKIYPNPIICVGKDKHITACNQMGSIFLDNLSTTDRDFLTKEALKCLQNSIKIQREFISGQQNYLTTFIVDNELVYIFTQEISDLIEFKSRVKEKEERHSTLIDTVPGFVSWINRDLKYLGVNQHLANAYEAKIDDFVGKTVGFLGADTNPNIADTMENFFNSGLEELQFEVEIDEEKGKRFLLLNASKFNNNNEVIIIGMDITKQRQTKEKLRAEVKRSEINEQLATLGYFQATLIHEINNPLMVAKANIETVQKKLAEDASSEDIQEPVALAAKSIDYLREITKTMKSLSRMDNNFDDREIISLGGLVQNLEFLLNPFLSKNGIKFTLENSIEGKDNIMGFTSELSMVIINLVKNAVDAVKEMADPFVRIVISNDGEKKLKLSVIDSGYGLKKEEGDKIFKSFYTTKKVGDGTGIGLALVKKIIEKNSGSISLNYDSPNTQFDIILNRVS
ncbi:HAMP domain-containing histidine kinase [Bacteriovoracaceae bacterium]|nr:HAMP domain-containing histidine kinase [Bacteriovoracaceae bacterium]